MALPYYRSFQLSEVASDNQDCTVYRSVSAKLIKKVVVINEMCSFSFPPT
jgi:hypothetical protein